MRTFLKFHSPVPCFNLRQDFITMLLENNLTTQQLFVIILNYRGISNGSQHAQDGSIALFIYFLSVL